MKKLDKKISFGLIVGTRNIFNAKLAQDAREVLLKQMEQWGFDTVILAVEEPPPAGAIETYQDAKKCAALFSQNHDKIDGIIVVLPNFGDDRNMCVCTHCSNYPQGFFQSEVEIGSLDVLGTVLDQEDTFGVVKGKVAPGPLTYFRVSTEDPRGCIKSYLGEGEITNDPYGMDGGIAVTRIPYLQPLMKYLCKNGFEHHVAMDRGHVAEIIEEAVGTYLRWELYRHE